MIPSLRLRGGGSIVFIGSTAGMRGVPGAAAYSASKAGLAALGRSPALEVASEGIRVNTIHPGRIRTPQTDLLFGADEQSLEARAHPTPLGRVAHPDAIASVVAFLVSDDSEFITATEVVVDGGMAARLA